MDIRVLNYFLVVAREENITKAAALLHVTQPTLSRQLMQLEEELGAKLFDRTGHSVALTEEGISFRIRARDIVALAEKAKSEIVTNEDTLTGTVSIGCVEMQSVRELSGWIVSFQRQYPKVKFELYSGSNEDIQERIEQGSLELGLFLLPFNLSRYATVQMRTRERWGVLVHQESPFAENRVIHPGGIGGNAGCDDPCEYAGTSGADSMVGEICQIDGLFYQLQCPVQCGNHSEGAERCGDLPGTGLSLR